MSGPILGLHHVTATVADAQADLDCWAGALGMRLVKKTVNFDNTGVYHFYYGDERGTPGTLMTTFPYAGQGVPVGTKGAGQITATALSVPAGSLDAWRRRLGERGLAVRDLGARFGKDAIAFADPSGLEIELVADARDARAPWVAEGLDPRVAVRGLHAVTLSIRELAPTLALLTDVLGFEVVGEEDRRTRVAAGSDGPGHALDILHVPDAPRAANGLGTVHHVAMAVADAETQRRVRGELVRYGLQVTEVLDRQYFRSIYFREPGGVLYEVATVPPGFTVDEPLARLGSHLKLPPWEEANRRAIAQALPPVSP